MGLGYNATSLRSRFWCFLHMKSCGTEFRLCESERIVIHHQSMALKTTPKDGMVKETLTTQIERSDTKKGNSECDGEASFHDCGIAPKGTRRVMRMAMVVFNGAHSPSAFSITVLLRLDAGLGLWRRLQKRVMVHGDDNDW